MIPPLRDIVKPYAPYAPSLLRWITGLFLLAHGFPKLFAVPEFLDAVGQHIAPVPLNYPVVFGTLIVENVLALFLIFGFQVRESALITACWFFGVAFVAHGTSLGAVFNLDFADNQVNFEYPFLIAINCLVLCVRGAGKLGFDPED
ncbi:MAG: DoxX family protein [Leptospiraceae bacterium]|nr:DoxX family protein [Leptospiraceae bacterium]